MWTLRRIDPLSAALFCAVFYALIGLLAGLVLFLFAMVGASANVPLGQMGGAGLGVIMMVLLLPIIYGITGFIGGLIAALFFNITAGLMGGVRIGLEPPEGAGIPPRL